MEGMINVPELVLETLIYGLAESQLRVTVTSVAVVPVAELQTFAPTGNSFGPVLTLLLSRPITFHE